MKRQEYNHKDLTGPDIDVETSLKEYGLAWIETEKEILFYYGTDHHDEWHIFDFAVIAKDTDVMSEYDWADFKAVSSFIGQSLEDFRDMSTLYQIEALHCYYGFEEIFGSTYWEGLTYDEIVESV